MKRGALVIASVATALVLGSATLAAASTAQPSDDTVSRSPGHHGAGNAPENHGQAGDPGPPDGVGEPGGAGAGAPAFLGGPPELPPNASQRARDAVDLAYERQQAIHEQVAKIQALESGPGKGEAVSALMKKFGQLFRLGALAAGGEDL